KITAYTDGLNIPIGIMPLRDGVMVHSIPNIYRFDGLEKGANRRVLYGPVGYRNDTHGMTGSFTWGFDGWLYACHGFANTSTLKASDGSSITMTSGNTYRMRADGSHVEQWTWGQVKIGRASCRERGWG